MELVALAAFTMSTSSLVTAAKVSFVNQCSHPIDLYDNSNVDPIAPGQTSQSRDIPQGTHPMFRHGRDPQATLAEFTVDDAVALPKAWYDISTVIPGSDNCKSLQECKDHTGGKTGFNVAMTILPKTNENQQGFNCVRVSCMAEGCADAYKFPSDDISTKSCPLDTEFEVVFCPGGGSGTTGGGGGAPSTSAPSTSTPQQSATSQPSTPAPPASTQPSTPQPPVTTQPSSPQPPDKTQPSTTPPPPPTKPSSPVPLPPAWSQKGSPNPVDQNGNNGNGNNGNGKNSTGPSPPPPTDSGANDKKTTSTVSVPIKNSFTYEGENVGNYPGSYQMVSGRDLAACNKQPVSVNYPLGPLSEEVSLAFRGPMIISNIAVFDGRAGGDWTRVSHYDGSSSNNIVFLNNKQVDYNGGHHSPQGYANADATDTAKEATLFGGKLADGVEMHVLTDQKCSEGGGECKGFKDDMSHHGWDGGRKVFLTKVQMRRMTPEEVNGVNPYPKDRPAVWMLNAQVVRSAQYGCNCRGMGTAGGCGELDIAEVIETDDQRDHVITHYYFYDGKPTGKEPFGPRPFDAPTIYITIFDEKVGKVRIVEIDGDGFDFSANSLSQQQIDEWLK